MILQLKICMKTIENFDNAVVQESELQNLYGGGGWTDTRCTMPGNNAGHCIDVSDQEKTNMWGTHKIRVTDVKERLGIC